MVSLWLLTGLRGIFSFEQLKRIEKLLARSKHPLARQPLRWLWASHAADSSGYIGYFAASLHSSWRLLLFPWMSHIRWFNVFWPEMVFLLSFFLSFPSLSFGFACRLCRKSNALQFIFSFDLISLLLFAFFFYLHWLFLIGFCFWFHLLLFDFLNLFSNLVLFFWIAIYFVSDCFFLQFHPKHLFFI